MRRWLITEHQGWGNHIQLSGRDERTMTWIWVGWTTPHPEAGDVIVVPMRSGKTAEFPIAAVRPCGDPPDMWFADCLNAEASYS